MLPSLNASNPKQVRYKTIAHTNCTYPPGTPKHASRGGFTRAHVELAMAAHINVSPMGQFVSLVTLTSSKCQSVHGPVALQRSNPGDRSAFVIVTRRSVSPVTGTRGCVGQLVPLSGKKKEQSVLSFPPGWSSCCVFT